MPEAACSFLQDWDAMDNRQCGAGKKTCGDKCVGYEDPATGCGALSCSPCKAAHVQLSGFTCTSGQCAIHKCEDGWFACTNDVANGCETPESQLDGDHHCPGDGGM